MKENNRKWDRWWSATLLAIGCTVFGAGLAWGVMRASMIAEHACNVRQDRKLAEHNGRIRTVEIGQARIQTSLKNLQAGQHEIKELIKNGN